MSNQIIELVVHVLKNREAICKIPAGRFEEVAKKISKDMGKSGLYANLYKNRAKFNGVLDHILVKIIEQETRYVPQKLKVTFGGGFNRKLLHSH